MTAPGDLWTYWFCVADPVGSWHAQATDHVAECGFNGDGLDVERAATDVLDLNNYGGDYVCTACLCTMGIAV